MKIALIILFSSLGLAFAWFFRPYGWFGQKARFFGSSIHPHFDGELTGREMSKILNNPRFRDKPIESVNMGTSTGQPRDESTKKPTFAWIEYKEDGVRRRFRLDIIEL